jgi:hypothetical protein
MFWSPFFEIDRVLHSCQRPAPATNPGTRAQEPGSALSVPSAPLRFPPIDRSPSPAEARRPGRQFARTAPHPNRVACFLCTRAQKTGSERCRQPAGGRSSQNRCFSPSFCKGVHKFSRNHQRGSFLKTHLFEKTGHFLLFLSKEVRFRIFFRRNKFVSFCVIFLNNWGVYTGYLKYVDLVVSLRKQPQNSLVPIF